MCKLFAVGGPVSDKSKWYSSAFILMNEFECLSVNQLPEFEIDIIVRDKIFDTVNTPLWEVKLACRKLISTIYRLLGLKPAWFKKRVQEL